MDRVRFPADAYNRDVKNKFNSAEIYSIDGKWYLDIVYVVEYPDKKVLLRFPKVLLDFTDDKISYNLSGGGLVYHLDSFTANFGFGDLELKPDKYGDYFTETVIEERPYKMTKADIEKKLGYKIEIVEESDGPT